MKPETQEWVEKAEGDLKVARREGQTADQVYDAVCFHAQQCAEKYLKAWLEEHNIAFPRIHDLIALLNLKRTEIKLYACSLKLASAKRNRRMPPS